MLYDRNIIGSSSEIFGYLRQSSVVFGKWTENVRRRSSSLRNNFGKSSEIFGKWSEIFGKSSKTSLLVCLYNKQNNTWTLRDMEFIFECSHARRAKKVISRHYLALRRMLWRHFSAEEPWVLDWVRISSDTCGRANSYERGNFWIGKEKLRIQKYPDTCGRGLKHTVIWEGKTLWYSFQKV